MSDRTKAIGCVTLAFWLLLTRLRLSVVGHRLAAAELQNRRRDYKVGSDRKVAGPVPRVGVINPGGESERAALAPSQIAIAEAPLGKALWSYWTASGVNLCNQRYSSG